jgi:ribosome-binding protein aMBF1 (putative translation factor)
MGDQQIRRLDSLVIEEASGVDHPASLADGWIVVKAEKRPPSKDESKGVTDEQRSQISERIARLAELRDLEPTAEELDAAVDAVLSGEADIDAVLGTFTAAVPPPPTVTVEPEDEPAVKKPPKKKPPKTPEEALAAYRKSVLDSDLGAERIAANASVLRDGNGRMSVEESIHKAAAGATGTVGVMALAANVAKALVEGGMAPGEAEVRAARVVGEGLSQQLADRETGRIRKEIDSAVAGVGAEIRVVGKAKGWSQSDLGGRIGKSATTIAEWERADHLPDKDNARQLEGALGDDGLADRVEAARSRGGR